MTQEPSREVHPEAEKPYQLEMLNERAAQMPVFVTGTGSRRDGVVCGKQPAMSQESSHFAKRKGRGSR